MKTFSTSREIPASINQVYAAISDPLRLSRWWGPEGFTNTFFNCEVKTGGEWSFVMHAPNGINHPNENQFTLVDPNKKVVIKHISQPRFELTIELFTQGEKTLVTWDQAFEDEKVALNVESVVVPSNEQNLDRLTNEVLFKSKKII